MKKLAYVGVDYHTEVISIAVVIEGVKGFHDTTRMKNDNQKIKRYFDKLSKEFDLRICYEASGSGYVFQRKLESWGYYCQVIAPSLTPKKPGDRRKNDFRDACNLAELYAKGLLTVVHLPTETEESVRSLIRCRLDFKTAEKIAKQKINGHLLAQGHRWPHSKWTHQHRQWLTQLQLRDDYSQMVLDEFLGQLSYLESRVAYLDQQIEQIAATDTYAPAVTKLRVFKGIETLTAMLLIAEITDFRRFASAKTLMAYLGLIPSEQSSGNKQASGAITKSGNQRCRTFLIEVVQHCVRKPHISAKMKANLSQVSSHSARIAVNCMHRLHNRYWHLVLRGKHNNKAKAAIAREFVGFIWAMMQPEEAAA